MTQETRPDVVWHPGHVSRSERAARLGQAPLTLWLTGLSAAGKSTLAFALERLLHERGRACYVLDGDNVRHGLNRNLGFSPADRSENIRRIAEVARLMNDAGLMVITAFISPWRADRAAAREIVDAASLIEVHVSTPLAVCDPRYPKGFYGQARRGKLADFTGVSSPYEAPKHPSLSIDRAELSLPDAVGQLTQLLARAPIAASP
ncbi:MAG: adenylyl-sulfate kinase [Candidatus Accumulibacter sp.]|uniref:Adenylyl-sulfate kinase n=1 Tax=Candidatus Accumulibacter proximus TaxID=2954385 RepID=A0A935PWZ3_9PROT|nr:adenylyl-sulfate kinase [Candidatus Accumulibacter proximus]